MRFMLLTGGQSHDFKQSVALSSSWLNNAFAIDSLPYEFPGAAVTKYHKLGGLRQHKFTVS